MFPASLIATESGGNWQAQNNARGAGGLPGHFGRLQFGQARLQDASRALGIGPISPQAFMADPELQRRVEQWHFQDVNKFIDDNNLMQYVGQTVNGVPVTRDGMIAAAHLGGNGGLLRHLQSGGRYNPNDGRTSLTDYMRTHANGGGNSQMNPALSANAMAGGPGMLSQGGLPAAPVTPEQQFMGLPVSGIADAFTGVGASLMAIDNPSGAAALTKQISDRSQGSQDWQVVPGAQTGTFFRVNRRTGAVEPFNDPRYNAQSAERRNVDASALREVQTVRQGINSVDAASDEGRRIFEDMESGRLDLGIINRGGAALQNWIGQSTENSQAYARWDSFLKRAANAIINQAAGVQTDSDRRAAEQMVAALGSANDNANGRRILGELMGQFRGQYRSNLDYLNSINTSYRGNDEVFRPHISYTEERLRSQEEFMQRFNQPRQNQQQGQPGAAPAQGGGTRRPLSSFAR